MPGHGELQMQGFAEVVLAIYQIISGDQGSDWVEISQRAGLAGNQSLPVFSGLSCFTKPPLWKSLVSVVLTSQIALQDLTLASAIAFYCERWRYVN